MSPFIIPLFWRDIFGYSFQFAAELYTICGQANSAAIEGPVRHNSTPRDGRRALCSVPAFLQSGFGLML
jgi:hypothetical protein